MAPLCKLPNTHALFLSDLCVNVGCVSFTAIRLLYADRWSVTFYCLHLLGLLPLPPLKKNTVFSCCCGRESSVACSCLSSDEEQTQRKRRGRGWKDSRSSLILGSDGEWHQHIVVYCNHESHRNTLKHWMGGQMWSNTPKIELWWW